MWNICGCGNRLRNEESDRRLIWVVEIQKKGPLLYSMDSEGIKQLKQLDKKIKLKSFPHDRKAALDFYNKLRGIKMAKIAVKPRCCNG